MFPTILDIKKAKKIQEHFFQNTTKGRMAHLNVSVAVKRRERLKKRHEKRFYFR